MTEKEYRDYKDDYLEDLRRNLEFFLNEWVKINKSPEDKKLNDAVVDIFTNSFKRLKTLSYFPEYNKP